MKDTKSWTQLLAIPSNRSCADCKAALVDTLQIYASFSPPPSSSRRRRRGRLPPRPPLVRDDDQQRINNNNNNISAARTKPKNQPKKIPPPPVPWYEQPHEETTTTTTSSTTTTTQQQQQQQKKILTLGTFQRNHFTLCPDYGRHHRHRRHNNNNNNDEEDDDNDYHYNDANEHLIDYYGVLVCAPCAAAHALTTSIVKPIHVEWDDTIHDNDPDHLDGDPGGVVPSSLEEWFLQIASNAKTNLRLERFLLLVPPPQRQRVRRLPRILPRGRPTTHSTVSERLVFCRAKYHAYDYVLPTGPLAIPAWQRLVYTHHPEWITIWGSTILEGLVPLHSMWSNQNYDDESNDSGDDGIGGGRTTIGSHPSGEAEAFQHLLGLPPSQRLHASTGGKLLSPPPPPPQLVDYFCVVTPTTLSIQDAIRASSSSSSSSSKGTSSNRNNNQNETIDEHLPFNAGTATTTPTGTDTSTVFLTPTVIDCYPDVDSTTFPNAIATFCFPDQCCASRTVLPPIFFTQVLTNGAGQRIYAAILTVHEPHTNNHGGGGDDDNNETTSSNENKDQSQLVWYIPKCLVLLSHYAFFDLFRNVLLQLYRIATTCEAPLPVERFLANFCREVPLPPPGRIKIQFGFTTSTMWEIARPPPNRLPLVNFSFEPLFACLSIPNVLTVLACLLRETRVALLSRHTALLCPVAEALLHLLFPLHWSGLYIPVLPYHMVDILEAPVPYLIGIHTRYAQQAIKNRCKTTVLVVLDDDTVHLGCDDAVLDALDPRPLPPLPERLTSKLRTRLIKAVGHRTYSFPGKGVITTGAELRQLLVVDRECYAHPVVPTATTSTHDDSSSYLRQRKDVLGNVDKAYMDNEWLVPIQGFLSETGQFHSKQPPKLPKQVPRKFHFRSASPLADHSSPPASPTSMENAPPVAGSRSILDFQGGPEDFSTDEIRDAFLRFFVSLLQDYRLYLAINGFRTKEFIDNEAPVDRPFMTGLVQTQMFECFVAERRECPDDPEVRFFDESISAKFNRSKMVLARGGKKETAFLDDTRYEFVETFTPPPPSNWGLPDDGALYHYSTFPKLRKELFGKVRMPQPWEQGDVDEMSSVRFSALTRRRSAYGFADTNFVASQQRPTFFFRPKKNFDDAMKTLSAPFSGRKLGMTTVANPVADGSDPSTSSDLSLSNHPDSTSYDDRLAEYARRRQMILIGILVKFQAHCRTYLARQRQLRRKQGLDMLRARSHSGLVSNDLAATVIQATYRSRFHQGRLSRLRKAVTILSSLYRGNRINARFRLFRRAVVRVQAGQRGRVGRREIYNIVAARMELYRRQIFELWHLLMTPLCYRSVFWSYLDLNGNCIGFVRQALAEEELKRLWSGLRDNFGDEPSPQEHHSVAAHMRNSTYQKAVAVQRFLKNEHTSASMVLKPMNGMAMTLSNSLIAERTQVYDKLAKLDEADVEALFGRFSISHGEKKKKATLAQTIWCSHKDANGSAHLMLKLFPEIKMSSRVGFTIPSKKALRRFGSTTTGLPDYTLYIGAGDPTTAVHRQLDERIRANNLEIAKAFLFGHVLK